MPVYADKKFCYQIPPYNTVNKVIPYIHYTISVIWRMGIVERTLRSSEYTARYKFHKTYYNIFAVCVTNASLLPLEWYINIKYIKKIALHAITCHCLPKVFRLVENCLSDLMKKTTQGKQTSLPLSFLFD